MSTGCLAARASSVHLKSDSSGVCPKPCARCGHRAAHSLPSPSGSGVWLRLHSADSEGGRAGGPLLFPLKQSLHPAFLSQGPESRAPEPDPPEILFRGSIFRKAISSLAALPRGWTDGPADVREAAPCSHEAHPHIGHCMRVTRSVSPVSTVRLAGRICVVTVPCRRGTHLVPRALELPES